ncbi:MAG TPA: aromatic-ring-hydroxylating dioxygenase subunit beta [Acidimicrobiales bacterium]|nr:aromatic-ring-hydroxylating dioxygenase subunit beta [Acidimicrobiales bacterium]
MTPSVTASDPSAKDPGAGDRSLVAMVERFLFLEAELVDDRRFEAWLELFADDATYEVPLRVTREAQAGSQLSDRGRMFWDSKETLAIRVQRLLSEYAWAEQPPSRTRHFVSNVRVISTGEDGALEVRSNVLVYRNRGDEPTHDLYSADRRDELVPLGDSFRIHRRWMAVDQSNLTGNSLSVFL